MYFFCIIDQLICGIVKDITGTNFKRARPGAAVQENSFPSESTFYRHQREFIPKIEDNVSTRLQKMADTSFEEKNVHLSVDGRYDSVEKHIIVQ